jgi:hypothetical protein
MSRYANMLIRTPILKTASPLTSVEGARVRLFKRSRDFAIPPSSILALLFFLTINISAQQNKVNKILDDIRTQLTTDKKQKINEEILFASGNEPFVLTGVKSWYNDTLKNIRSRALTITARMGLKTQEPAFRQEALRLIVKACNDKDAALAGSAINYLTHFNRRDFTKDACDSIVVLLKKQTPQFEKLARIVGFLNLKEQVPFLQNILTEGKASTKIQWNIHLALARMGNEGSAKSCLDLAKGYPLDDNIMYYILPDLLYTRQKPVFDFLLEILYSDKKNCTSPNPNFSGHILCGYRVMEALAAVVKDFPLKTNSSEGIVTQDYDKALQITRDWFKEHKEYELKIDIY